MIQHHEESSLNDNALRSMLSKKRVIVIVGPTGSGKTKLSIDIASRAQQCGMQPHIISCDSMQIYKDIRILNAKISEDQMKGIPHHLIDIIPATDDTYSVHSFRGDVECLLKTLFDKDADVVPILVGGTNLYVESLILSSKYRLIHHEGDLFEQKYAESTNDELFEILKNLDENRANQVHKNDRKRVLRWIIKLVSPGVEQVSSNLDSEYEFCIICLVPELKVLYKWLNDRVNEMVKEGLKEEILWIIATWNKYCKPINYTKGILQSIGIKEFKDWIDHYQNTQEDDEVLFNQCVERLKVKTRNYARSQISWIKNRFLRHPILPYISLDPTDIETWDSSVLEPCWNFVTNFLSGELQFEISNEQTCDKPAPLSKLCDICNKVLRGDVQWNAHIKSRAHRTRKKKLQGDEVKGCANSETQ